MAFIPRNAYLRHLLLAGSRECSRAPSPLRLAPLGATAFALEPANPETHVALNAPCTVVLLLPRLPCHALPCLALYNRVRSVSRRSKRRCARTITRVGILRARSLPK